jgi:hypothetical protein
MSATVDQDRRDGLVVFQGDMAEHQRITGREVTGEANRQLAATLFGQLEQQGALDRPADPTPAIAEPAPPQSVSEKRSVNGREYTFTIDGDQGGNPVPMSAREKELTVKALRRLHMLLELQDEGVLGAPSWRTRACAVMAVASNQARFAQELDELLDASSKYFGDWRIDPDKKIIVG